MTERILEIVSLLGSWGYLIIFLAAFLESAAFLGLLVPGESVVIVAGILSSQGYLDLGDSIAVVSLGAIAGDSVGYALGHVLGRGYLERHGRLFFIRPRHIERADEYFRAHGGKTVFFGRFVGFLRAVAPFAAGISRMSYGRFFAYNVLGGVLWAASFTLLGYFFALSWQTVEKWTGRAGVFVFFILLVFIGFGYLYGKLLKRQAAVKSWFLERYGRLLSSPLIKAFAWRHPGVAVFATERLTPSGYLGVHLAAGLILSAVFIWLLSLVMAGMITVGRLELADQWALASIHYFRTPAVTAFLRASVDLGGPLEITAAGGLACLYLLVKRRRAHAACLLTGLFGSGVLTIILKSVLHRMEASWTAEYAWPGALALVSVVFYGMAAYFLARDARSWKRQVLISLSSLFIVFLAGFASMYLQYERMTEVLAGYAGGLLWLVVCVTGLEVYRKMSRR